ncbi:MAG: gfo/Idh/MocA family oxidoreductase, partial [Candidatus Hydrogenedentes bacterium]|nr:gfo/Idh/MocA family oxidoreductase [Candidatus Hydrogenedentota bacterium]
PESGLFTTATQVYFECRYANGVELVCKTGRFGMTFEGTEGTIYVDRKQIVTLPDELKKEKIGDDEIHLYESSNHYRNFIDCVKSREKAICDEEVGHRSSTVCNLGNIAMRLGRKLDWDPKAERFVNDDEANQYLGRDIRGDWSLEA